MKIIRKKLLIAFSLTCILICNYATAQNSKLETEKLVIGTWNLDSLEINSNMLPEAMIKVIYSKMQESKKYTTYFFGKDGKYVNKTVSKSVEGTWELSKSGDTLKLMLPEKTIFNKILQIDEKRFTIEPLGETKEAENGKIFMIKPEE